MERIDITGVSSFERITPDNNNIYRYIIGDADGASNVDFLFKDHRIEVGYNAFDENPCITIRSADYTDKIGDKDICDLNVPVAYIPFEMYGFNSAKRFSADYGTEAFVCFTTQLPDGNLVVIVAGREKAKILVLDGQNDVVTILSSKDIQLFSKLPPKCFIDVTKVEKDKILLSVLIPAHRLGAMSVITYSDGCEVETNSHQIKTRGINLFAPEYLDDDEVYDHSELVRETYYNVTEVQEKGEIYE